MREQRQPTALHYLFKNKQKKTDVRATRNTHSFISLRAHSLARLLMSCTGKRHLVFSGTDIQVRKRMQPRRAADISLMWSWVRFGVEGLELDSNFWRRKSCQMSVNLMKSVLRSKARNGARFMLGNASPFDWAGILWTCSTEREFYEPAVEECTYCEYVPCCVRIHVDLN